MICRKMESIDLVSKATVDDLIFQKFESPLPKSQDDDDPFIKGEFDVIKELLEKMPATAEGKRKIDRVIDICGGPPKGTGIQNLRECIIETKWKYDVASEDKQVAWKALILNFMERYFYLICFATYALEHGPSGYQKSFVCWMDDNKDLRGMIGEISDEGDVCIVVLSLRPRQGQAGVVQDCGRRQAGASEGDDGG